MSRNFPTATNIHSLPRGEGQRLFLGHCLNQSPTQVLGRKEKVEEATLVSWFGSGLWGELSRCRKEMTPGDHLRYWLLPASSNQMNPPKIRRAWHRAVLEASQGSASRTWIKSSRLQASLRGAVSEHNWVCFPGGRLTSPKTRKHRQERARAHCLS